MEAKTGRSGRNRQTRQPFGITFLRCVLCVTLSVLTLAPAAWAQVGRITGRVLAEDIGETLPGANVECFGPNLSRSEANSGNVGNSWRRFT